MWVENTPSVLEHTCLYICHSKGKKITPTKKICKEGFWLAPLDHMLPLSTVFTRITWFGWGSSSTTKEEVAIFRRNEGKQDSWLSKEMIYQRSCCKWGTDSGLERESIKWWLLIIMEVSIDSFLVWHWSRLQCYWMLIHLYFLKLAVVWRVDHKWASME